MPRLEPFRGLRYDTGTVSMNEVIAPPYDIIEPPERAALAKRHPANAVLVELPEPQDGSNRDRYEEAAFLLADWQERGILHRDATPCLYVYRMTLPDGDRSTGVIGALATDPEQRGDVLPHEKTLPKPKSDRLDLLRATRTNLSPIWGLSLTAGLSATFEPSGEPAAAATDDQGVRHELWVVDDTATIGSVQKAVAASPVVIADGHHRYETALAYRRERLEAGDVGGGDIDLVMALVMELSADELKVGPIHRTIAGLTEEIDLATAFAPWFEVEWAGETTDELVRTLGESQTLAIVTGGGAWKLAPKDAAYEAAGSDLDSSLVALVLDELDSRDGIDVSHCHTWQEAAAALSSGAAHAAVLLRPVTVEQIAEWARVQRRMPPKSTYFFPKPRTGMVFRTLDG